MATSKDAAVPTTGLVTSRPLKSYLVPIIIFLLAFIPRAAAMGKFVTPDEPIWVFRSLGLRQALLSADWANTIQSGHPGVTTTWLGALAAQINLWLSPQSREHLQWLDQLYWLTPENGAAMQRLASFLTTSRLAVILVASLGIMAIYILARNRIGPLAGLTAALLLAFDPFIAGLGLLFHVDGILALFMILTILLIMPMKTSGSADADTGWSGPGRIHLLLAGITTGLAILTKSPGLFLAFAVPLIYLWPGSPNGPYRGRLISLLYLVAAAVITGLILLPALWAAPGKVVDITNELASRLIESGIRPSFFLGQLTLDPGPAFYPIAIAFRLSPLVSLGLLFLVVWAVIRLARRRSLGIPANINWLLLFSIGFTLFMNLSAKRFDRYALPAVVALTLVAGWSLAFIFNRYLSKKRFSWAVKVLFLLIVIGYFAIYWPYPLSAYNPLLGGTSIAQKALPIGWGEGASDGARWASQLENASYRTLYTGNVPSAASFFPGSVKSLSKASLAYIKPEDLLMFDDQDWQREPDFFHQSPESPVPVYTELDNPLLIYSSSFNGLPRTAVYSGISPGDLAVESLIKTPLSLTFANRVDLLDSAVRPTVWPDNILLTLKWMTREAAEYQLQLELVDTNENTWLVRETPLLNSVDHPSQFWTPNEIQTAEYHLTLEPDLPPGNYQVRARLFDEQGTGLGVFDSGDKFRGTSAAVASLFIDSPASQPQLNIPNQLDNDNELSGFADIPPVAESGLPLILDIWWQPRTSTPAEAQLQLNIGATSLLSPLSHEYMLPGFTYHLKHEWLVPFEMPGGDYSVTINLLDKKGHSLWSEPISLGSILIETRDRQFEMPPGINPLEISLADVGYLQSIEARPAEEFIEVPVIWQSIGRGLSDYTVFAHLVDLEGNIIDQDDRFPVVNTSSWAPGQVIQDQHQLMMPAPGKYTITIGLYDAQNGARVPMLAADGRELPGNQYVLEVTVP